MTERQMEFRVGLFVLAATTVAGVMIFRFGELKDQFSQVQTVTVHFRDASGIHGSSPVRMSGIQIGTVRDVRLDERNGGVLVELGIRPEFTVREGSQPRVTTSILGDAAIEFSPGIGSAPLKPNALVPGIAAASPMEAVDRLEQRMGTAMDVFTQTGREWGRVGNSVNQALQGPDGQQMHRVMQSTLASLEEFTRTMRSANQTLNSAQSLLADKETQAGLKQTLHALPQLVNDTRTAIQSVSVTVQRMDKNMQYLDAAMRPLASNAKPMATRLNATLANLETLSGELAQFSKLLRNRDGSIQRLVADPSLYRNLNATAASLAVFLKNAEPVVSDLRIFSDKIARHPELIGVRGAIRGSSGLKQVDYEQKR